MKKILIIIGILIGIILFDTIQSLIFNTSPALSVRSESDYGYVYDDGILSFTKTYCDGTKKAFKFFRGAFINRDCRYYLIDSMIIPTAEEK